MTSSFASPRPSCMARRAEAAQVRQSETLIRIVLDLDDVMHLGRYSHAGQAVLTQRLRFQRMQTHTLP
jgi:hypothetical protein